MLPRENTYGVLRTPSVFSGRFLVAKGDFQPAVEEDRGALPDAFEGKPDCASSIIGWEHEVLPVPAIAARQARALQSITLLRVDPADEHVVRDIDHIFKAARMEW